MGAGRRLILQALLLAGCTTEEWRNADHQLDIFGASWDTEERARLCVEGVGILEEAMAVGRIGYTGVPEDIEVVLTVDLLDEDDTSGAGLRRGGAGPISFADGDWQGVDWQVCEGDCPACTTSGDARTAAGGQLLAVRFLPVSAD